MLVKIKQSLLFISGKWYINYENAIFDVSVNKPDKDSYIINSGKFANSIIQKNDCEIISEPKEIDQHKKILKSLEKLSIDAKKLFMFETYKAIEKSMVHATSEIEKEKSKYI